MPQAVIAEESLQRTAEELQAAIADLVRVYQFRDRDRICCYDISVTQCYALETLVNAGPLRRCSANHAWCRCGTR